MINKISHSISRRGVIWAGFLLVFAFMLAQPDKALAQCATCTWATNGNHINNTNTGGVGIGTPNPGGLLHLHVNSGDVVQRFSGAGNAGGALDLRYKFESSQHRMGMTDAAGGWLFYTQYAPSNTSSIGYFPGNVGIGTTTPASKLEVIGNIALSDSSRITARSDFGNYLMPYTSFGRMAFGTQGVDRLSILYNGNVGIGTHAPTDKLEINGGSLYMNGDSMGVVVDSGGLRRIAFVKYPGREAGIWRVSGQDFEIGRVNPQVPALPGNPTAFTTDLYIAGSGNIGVGTTEPTAKLHVVGDVALAGTGNITASGTVTAGSIVAKYQDIAEWVPARHTISAGTVVVLDTENSNHVVASLRAYDTRVAGVVSDSPGVILGEGGEGKVKVATTGRVRVKVDATRAPIHVGDLLVTSDKEGVAMRSEPLDLGGTPIHRPGTLIGKALEPLNKGVGEILVLLSLQ